MFFLYDSFHIFFPPILPDKETLVWAFPGSIWKQQGPEGGSSNLEVKQVAHLPEWLHLEKRGCSTGGGVIPEPPKEKIWIQQCHIPDGVEETRNTSSRHHYNRGVAQTHLLQEKTGELLRTGWASAHRLEAYDGPQGGQCELRLIKVRLLLSPPAQEVGVLSLWWLHFKRMALDPWERHSWLIKLVRGREKTFISKGQRRNFQWKVK